MTNLPKKKNIRLKNYDYSKAGYYFITICTSKRLNLLSNIVGCGLNTTPLTELKQIGTEIIRSIEFISNQYQNVSIDAYIIMPNHIHLIIVLQENKLDGQKTPPIHKIVGQLKSFTNKKYNEINKTKCLILWQRNYYEHIIRNEKEYESIYEYIETNPFKWEDDEYYS
jgi:putative transposase